MPDRVVAVPWARLGGWLDRYDARHPDASWSVTAAAMTAIAPDGSSASFAIPFAPPDGLTRAGVLGHIAVPRPMGLLLVRRGGFAVARLAGEKAVEVKIGQRHVQGRSKAGGWSQQRFARRRDNQAKAAYEAASGYAQTILLPTAAQLVMLGVGGDRAAIAEVLGERRLAPLAARPQQWLGGLPDPNKGVLARAVESLCSVAITLTDP